MNEFLKKEHTGPPRTCRNEESTPRCSTALGLPSCWSNANGPQRPRCRGGEQPVAVSPELCSYSRSHSKAEITGRTRDPHSTSGQQTRPPSLTLQTSRCSLVFTSLDLRRSFMAVSRSASSSVTWAERAARLSFIWLCSCDCLSMTSWSSITLARSSLWLRELSEGL